MRKSIGRPQPPRRKGPDKPNAGPAGGPAAGPAGGGAAGAGRKAGHKAGRSRQQAPRTGAVPGGRVRLYGRHAGLAALRNPERVIHQLWAAPAMVAELATVAGGRHPAPQVQEMAELDQLVPPGASHQGLVVEAKMLTSVTLEEVITQAAMGGRISGPVLVLDQVTDPQNVGAILRSAAAFGALCVVTQDRHSPEESGALAKAASGCLELVSWVRVVNVARALDQLADAGFWRVGLDGQADLLLEAALDDPRCQPRCALVLGAEGRGLRQNVAAHCDVLARLPISDQVESLNVSTATAIALYAATRAAGSASTRD